MKTKSGISPLLLDAKDKSSLRFTDEDKANILQDQFCSVFTKEPSGVLPEFPSRTMKNVALDLTVDMVREELKSLNPNKSHSMVLWASDQR